MSYYDDEETITYRRPKAKGRKVIPVSVMAGQARQDALEGKPSARCELCGITYAMSFIIWTKFNSFKEGHACRVCMKSHNLHSL